MEYNQFCLLASQARQYFLDRNDGKDHFVRIDGSIVYLKWLPEHGTYSWEIVEVEEFE